MVKNCIFQYRVEISLQIWYYNFFSTFSEEFLEKFVAEDKRRDPDVLSRSSVMSPEL